MKVSLNLGGIFTQGLEIVIFSGSRSTIPYDSFLPGEKIRMNPRDGGFPKRPNCRLQVSNWPVLLDLE